MYISSRNFIYSTDFTECIEYIYNFFSGKPHICINVYNPT